jgi:SSS family solute:Na+ symporter
VHVWGLHVVDLTILLIFLFAILTIGWKVSHGVKEESDFYLGGRKLGRVLQFFLNFGNATDSTGAVQTSSEVFRQGASGVWLGLQTLFITPFFWFTQPWYRRARLVTMADLFVDRFNSKSLASAYAAFNILIALITLGTGNIAAYKVAAAMIVKEPTSYTDADRQRVEHYNEYQRLKAQRIAGTMPQSAADQFRYLDDLNARGELSSDVPYFGKVPFLIGYSAIVAAYIILGGLKAAAITDAVQGVLVLLMSILLIPLGLHRIGGFHEMHLRVPAFKFQIFGDAAVSEYAWYTIAAITFASLVQILGLMHNMSAGGSARDEDTARFGMISGGFMKRFILIAWMFCGLIAIALLGGSLADPDAAWGTLSKSLLMPGLMGIMLSGMLLGHMPAVGVTSVAVSALATRNLYEPLVPRRSERHYLRIGQIAIAVVLGVGIAVATFFTGVAQAWTMMITFNTYFGAVVFLIFFWRRLTPSAIMIGLVAWVVLLGVVPWFLPTSQTFRRQPALLQKTNERQVVDDAGKTRTILPKAIYFDNVAHANPDDPASPLEGIGRFNIETYSLHLIGVPMASFSPAELLATRWAFDGIFPFIMLIVLSWLTPRSEPQRADFFYAKLKTPVGKTPEADEREVRLSFDEPHRFDDQKLLPGTNWEFTRWTRKDVVGFFGCWSIVGVILLVLWAVLHVGS